MTISQVKRQTRVAEWAENIREQQSSGQTVKAWCAGQGLGEGRFYYWLKLVREMAIMQVEQASQRTSLIKIEPERLRLTAPSLSTAASNPQTGIVIRHGSTTAELPEGISLAAVAELLKALNVP